MDRRRQISGKLMSPRVTETPHWAILQRHEMLQHGSVVSCCFMHSEDCNSALMEIFVME